jgi:hypothetical protein
MKPSGAHTHPDGGPGLGLAVIVALVLIVAGSAGAAVHTAEHALDVLVHVLLVVLAVAAGMSLAGLGFCVFLRRRYEARPAPWHATVEPPATRPMPARSAPYSALPAPLIHVHGHGPVTAAELAELVSRQGNPPLAIEEDSQ